MATTLERYLTKAITKLHYKNVVFLTKKEMKFKFSAILGLANPQYVMTNPMNYAKNYLKKIDDKLKVDTKAQD